MGDQRLKPSLESLPHGAELPAGIVTVEFAEDERGLYAEILAEVVADDLAPVGIIHDADERVRHHSEVLTASGAFVNRHGNGHFGDFRRNARQINHHDFIIAITIARSIVALVLDRSVRGPRLVVENEVRIAANLSIWSEQEGTCIEVEGVPAGGANVPAKTDPNRLQSRDCSRKGRIATLAKRNRHRILLVFDNLTVEAQGKQTDTVRQSRADRGAPIASVRREVRSVAMLPRPPCSRMLTSIRKAALAAFAIFAPVSVSQPACMAADGWTRHVQPDSGSIDLPADWIVLRLADRVEPARDGSFSQKLVSARGVFSGVPVVLAISRRTASQIPLEHQLETIVASMGQRVPGQTRLGTPALPESLGARAVSSMYEFSAGPEQSRTMIVVVERGECVYVMSVTSRAQLEAQFASIRSEILSRWRPGSRFDQRDRIAMPVPPAQTIDFASGGSLSIPEGWFVIERDAEREDIPVDGSHPVRAYGVQQLVNLRKLREDDGAGDVATVARARALDSGGDAINLLDDSLRDFAGLWAASIEESWRLQGGIGDPIRSGEDPIEVTLPRGGGRLAWHASIWRSGSEILVASSSASADVDARRNATALREGYRGSSTRQLSAPIAALNVTRQVPPIADDTRANAPRRSGWQLGASIAALLVFGLPCVVGSCISLRAGLLALAMTVLGIGAFTSYGQGLRTATIVAETQASAGQAVANGVAETAGLLTIPLECLGESIKPVTWSTMPELAARAALGELHVRWVMLTVLALGICVSTGGPLCIRYVVLRRRCSRRRHAIALALIWWGVCVAILTAVGSSNASHRACALGTGVTMLLVVPTRGRPASPLTADPVVIPKD